MLALFHSNDFAKNSIIPITISSLCQTKSKAYLSIEVADYVERYTGYDFFSNVSASIQSQIESVVDNQLIEDWEMMPDKEAIEENLTSSDKFDQKPTK